MPWQVYDRAKISQPDSWILFCYFQEKSPGQETKKKAQKIQIGLALFSGEIV